MGIAGLEVEEWSCLWQRGSFDFFPTIWLASLFLHSIAHVVHIVVGLAGLEVEEWNFLWERGSFDFLPTIWLASLFLHSILRFGGCVELVA